MYHLYKLFPFLIVIFIIIITWAFFFFLKVKYKNGSYECGYDSWGVKTSLFSIRFFLLVILFLIFDIEIIFIFPILKSIFNIVYWINDLYVVLFLFIILTTIYEWYIGVIEWEK